MCACVGAYGGGVGVFLVCDLRFYAVFLDFSVFGDFLDFLDFLGVLWCDLRFYGVVRWCCSAVLCPCPCRVLCPCPCRAAGVGGWWWVCARCAVVGVSWSFVCWCCGSGAVGGCALCPPPAVLCPCCAVVPCPMPRVCVPCVSRVPVGAAWCVL